MPLSWASSARPARPCYVSFPAPFLPALHPAQPSLPFMPQADRQLRGGGAPPRCAPPQGGQLRAQALGRRRLHLSLPGRRLARLLRALHAVCARDPEVRPQGLLPAGGGRGLLRPALRPGRAPGQGDWRAARLAPLVGRLQGRPPAGRVQLARTHRQQQRQPGWRWPRNWQARRAARQPLAAVIGRAAGPRQRQQCGTGAAALSQPQRGAVGLKRLYPKSLLVHPYTQTLCFLLSLVLLHQPTNGYRPTCTHTLNFLAICRESSVALLGLILLCARSRCHVRRCWCQHQQWSFSSHCGAGLEEARCSGQHMCPPIPSGSSALVYCSSGSTDPRAPPI